MNLMNFDSFDPAAAVAPEGIPYRDLPRVTNSGLYDLALHKVTLSTRMIKGTPRECLEVQAVATLQTNQQHTGRVSFKVDLPERGSPRSFDHFFYELAYFTNSFHREETGRIVPYLETEEVSLPYTRFDGSTSETVVKSMAGATLSAALARRNSTSGTGFFMNVLSFFSPDGFTMQEIETHSATPEIITRYRNTLRSEGYELDRGNSASGSQMSQDLSQALQQRASAGASSPATPAYQGYAGAKAQQQGPMQRPEYNTLPGFVQPAQPAQIPQVQAAPNPMQVQRQPVQPVAPAYQAYAGYAQPQAAATTTTATASAPAASAAPTAPAPASSASAPVQIPAGMNAQQQAEFARQMYAMAQSNIMRQIQQVSTTPAPVQSRQLTPAEQQAMAKAAVQIQATAEQEKKQQQAASTTTPADAEDNIPF